MNGQGSRAEPPRRRRWLAAAGLSAAALWILAGPACGSEAPRSPDDLGGGGSGGASASSSTTKGSASSSSTGGSGAGGPGECYPGPLPAGVPEDWAEWTDWSCDCRLYVPGPDALLPPITWAPCAEAPPGIDCEALATDWLDGMTGFIGAGQPGPGMDVDADGKATLQFYRAVPYHYTMSVVADAEGPVHTAVLRPHPGYTDHQQIGCFVIGEDVNEGRHLLMVKGAHAGDAEQSPDCGAFGGTIGDPAPTLFDHYEGSGTPGWRAGAQWLARLVPGSVFTAHPWDMTEEHFITSTATDPDGYKVTQPFISGDAVFWMAGGSLYGGGLMVWDVVHGARNFVRWPGDKTRMAANLGSDGVDMVWSEGEGKEPSEPHTAFPIRRIMTAPFTSDPDQLEPRRLREQPGQVGQVWPWVVGCGYGAFDNQGQKLVVRLSDGWMWIVPTFPGFSRPVGITCEHVYLRHNTLGTLVRLRLDSLGPGLEPD